MNHAIISTRHPNETLQNSLVSTQFDSNLCSPDSAGFVSGPPSSLSSPFTQASSSPSFTSSPPSSITHASFNTIDEYPTTDIHAIKIPHPRSSDSAWNGRPSKLARINEPLGHVAEPSPPSSAHPLGSPSSAHPPAHPPFSAAPVQRIFHPQTLSALSRQKFRRGEIVRCASMTLIPGLTKRWKRVKKRVGRIWTEVWEEEPGSEDPLFRRNLDSIAKSNAASSRRVVRSTRTMRHSMHGEGLDVSIEVPLHPSTFLVFFSHRTKTCRDKSKLVLIVNLQPSSILFSSSPILYPNERWSRFAVHTPVLFFF